MVYWFKYTVLFHFILFSHLLFSQLDSSKKHSIQIQLKNDSSVLFQNKKIEHDNPLNESKLEIGAYVSTYAAFYTEDNSTEFVKHATMAARNNQFGLNMVMISLGYKSKKIRSKRNKLSLTYPTLKLESNRTRNMPRPQKKIFISHKFLFQKIYSNLNFLN